ncbi:hypothetical protein HYE58_08415 [Aggregatibacter actinomycetemcomitans]|nr:hypothetical protein [Aggregatibacter actinomycetemcomitans]
MCEKTAHRQAAQAEETINPATNENESLLDREHALNFNLGRSIRYHKARQHFFDLLDKFTNVISIVFGSGSVFALSQQNTNLAMWLGLTLTVLSALALVFGFATKARDHFDFSKQYAVLERQLIKEPLTKGLLDSVADEIRAIESNEPKVLKALNDLCWNEEAAAQGVVASELKKVSLCRFMTCQLF